MSASNFSVQTANEKSSVASDKAFITLLELQLMNAATQQFVDTLYFANNNENIIYRTNTYIAGQLDLTYKQEAGAMPELDLSVIDYARLLGSKLQQYSGASGSLAVMTIVNTGNLSAPPEISETFEVISTSASSFAVSLKLGMESGLRKQFPRRTQMINRCGWRYKSIECGYTGSMPTCDLSRSGTNGCSAHSNGPNFGGFPGITNRQLG